MTRALVTGGAGFLGSHLCRRLLDDGLEVVCVDNLATGTADNVAGLQGDGFELIHADICMPLQLDRDIDLLFHLASPASPPAYLRLPIETLMVGSLGTKNMLDLATDRGARFLLTSTSEIYGDPEVRPQREDYRGNVSTTGPRSVYDEAKRFAESLTMAYHRHYGLDTCIARIFNTYGPRMDPNDGRAVPNFLKQALRDASITVYGDGSQTRSFCYVDDLIEGLVALASSGFHDPVNLGNPDERTILELAETIIEMTNSKSPVVFEDLPEDDPMVRCPDISRAREVLGWEPKVPLREGLGRTIEWFRQSVKP